MNPSSTKSLVLVGGGHANIQVIKSLSTLSSKIKSKLNIILVDKYDSSTYSGMIPGCVSKLYKPHEACIPFQPIANYAGIQFIQDEVIDIQSNYIQLLKSKKRIDFDCLSLDLGSTVRGINEIPGVKEHTIPTRPINNLISRIEEAEIVMKNNKHQHYSLVVVGGGFAGIEMALTLRNRWKDHFPSLEVTLINADTQLLSSESLSCRNFMNQRLKENNINILNSTLVSKITEDGIEIRNKNDLPENGQQKLSYTHCIWATGAAPHTNLTNTLLQSSILSLDPKGWIKVHSTFQSTSYPNIFAAGDCCSMHQYPNTPKAGVYAVRAGPILHQNILSYIFHQDSELLQSYKPQSDFLKLINIGDGTAIGFRFNLYFYGKWVMALKDYIDRTFINLFLEGSFKVKDDHKEGEHVKQYDAIDYTKERIDAKDAASILTSEDANDYHLPSKIITDMANDEEYANDIVNLVKLVRNE